MEQPLEERVKNETISGADDGVVLAAHERHPSVLW